MFHTEQKKFGQAKKSVQNFLYIVVKKLFPIGVFPVV